MSVLVNQSPAEAAAQPSLNGQGARSNGARHRPELVIDAPIPQLVEADDDDLLDWDFVMDWHPHRERYTVMARVVEVPKHIPEIFLDDEDLLLED